MKRVLAYWISPISNNLKELNYKFRGFSYMKKMILVAFLCTFAALFQSAGIVPGIGYLISFLATAPIMVAVFISIRHGLFAYILTILLLLVLQPSELIIFPFTTGLLALGIGIGFHFLKRRIAVIAFGAIWLCAGISAILYIFQFPVLGPVADTSFQIEVVLIIYILSLLYSWLWVEIGRGMMGKLINIIKVTP